MAMNFFFGAIKRARITMGPQIFALIPLLVKWLGKEFFPPYNPDLYIK